MGHGHAHGGASHGRRQDRRRLALMLGLVSVYMVAEVIGGLVSGSLALLADAGHMLSDAAALALSLFAVWIAERPSAARRTFGHLRAEILAALANGVALLAVAFLIVVEAVERFADPPEVRGSLMLVVASGGLVVNLAGLAILHGGSQRSLNVRGAFLHVLSDALGSVGALAAGVAVWQFGWYLADPLASLVIAVLVVVAAWHLVREAVDVLMEAAPRHLDVDEIRTELQALPDVTSVHDLHVWTITSGSVALSCHVVHAAGPETADVLGSVQGRLRERFGIDHATVQVETEGFADARDGGEACAGACDGLPATPDPGREPLGAN